MPPKKRQNAETKDEKFVYVLTLKGYNHGGDPQEPEVVGVYGSKEAAAAAAGEVKCSWRTFEEAIKDETFEDCHIDNRKNPPDEGCLLKYGDEDHGEGDYEELIIQKFPLLEEVSTGRKKKAK